MLLRDQVCTYEQADVLATLGLNFTRTQMYWVKPQLLKCFRWKEERDAPRNQYEFYKGLAIDDIDTQQAFISLDRQPRRWEEQISKASYRPDPEDASIMFHMTADVRHGGMILLENNFVLPAPNVAELGLLLPTTPDSFYFSYRMPDGRWTCVQSVGDQLLNHYGCLCPTEAEARAAMLIHELQNKRIFLTAGGEAVPDRG